MACRTAASIRLPPLGESSSWLNKHPRQAARRWVQTRNRCCGSFARSPTPNRMHSACNSPAWAERFNDFVSNRRSLPMIVLVDTNDGRAVRNKDNVLALYDLMINKKK